MKLHNVPGLNAAVDRLQLSDLEAVTGPSNSDTFPVSTKSEVKILSTAGPDEEKLKFILDRSGYSLTITKGQRKYGGPPPNWIGLPPSNRCQVILLLNSIFYSAYLHLIKM